MCVCERERESMCVCVHVCECVEERLCIYSSGGARQGICVLVDERITRVFVVVKEYTCVCLCKALF